MLQQTRQLALVLGPARPQAVLNRIRTTHQARPLQPTLGRRVTCAGAAITLPGVASVEQARRVLAEAAAAAVPGTSPEAAIQRLLLAHLVEQGLTSAGPAGSFRHSRVSFSRLGEAMSGLLAPHPELQPHRKKVSMILQPLAASGLVTLFDQNRPTGMATVNLEELARRAIDAFEQGSSGSVSAGASGCGRGSSSGGASGSGGSSSGGSGSGGTGVRPDAGGCCACWRLAGTRMQ